MDFVLKSVSSDTNIATTALVSICMKFLFTSPHFQFVYVFSSFKQNIDGSFFLIQSLHPPQLCLFIEAFIPLTFKSVCAYCHFVPFILVIFIVLLCTSFSFFHLICFFFFSGFIHFIILFIKLCGGYSWGLGPLHRDSGVGLHKMVSKFLIWRLGEHRLFPEIRGEITIGLGNGVKSGLG